MTESQTNLLLVDDHPENLLALEELLRALNLNVVKAASGAEALRHLLEQDFAVVVLDVEMPGIDGLETAVLIHQREKTRHLPVLFTTAHQQTSKHVLQGYAVGLADFIFKPIHPDILLAKVRLLLRLHRLEVEVQDLRRELEAAV
jgi:CheY-like chemotaxis protein